MDLTKALSKVKTPAYVIDEGALKRNLEILRQVERESGCHILLAQKCYSAYKTYHLIGQYISGCTASGLYEAKLGFEEMGKENHVFSPAYLEEEFDQILDICDHISFNSLSQWEKYKESVKAAKKPVSCGIRINPQRSTQEDHAIYDPCAPFSRLGVTCEQLGDSLPDEIEGVHFHTLCEQNADALVATLEAVEEKFGNCLYQAKWLNMGGGHHITREDYDRELLVSTICRIKSKYNVEVYLEPGEAVALNAGWLVSTVLETGHNGMDIAITDASAACHMPDVLEMPYRPEIIGSGKPTEKPFTFRLGGNTCLAGDIIGDYSFDKPLKSGDKLIFCDMAIYSMVKNNTFNGMRLPDICLLRESGEVEVLNSFGYEDFKGRL